MGNNPKASGAFQNISLDNIKGNEAEIDNQYTRAAIKYIANNPLQFIKLIPIKMYHIWAKDGEAEYSYQAVYANNHKAFLAFRTVRIINQAYYTALMILAFMGVFYIVKNKQYHNNALSLLGVAFFLYISIVYCFFFGQSRFHFPAMPLIIMYSSYALYSLQQNKKVP
jgi:hypothetical protein